MKIYNISWEMSGQKMYENRELQRLFQGSLSVEFLKEVILLEKLLLMKRVIGNNIGEINVLFAFKEACEYLLAKQLILYYID